MYLEQLPDELLLFIFGYLQKFDVFYAFSQLNRRFQQILDPYSYTIDLTEKSRPSYRQFRQFLDYVLPLYRRNIRLLKISGQHQCQLLKNRISSFSNLQTLVIEAEDCEEDEFDSIKDDQHSFLHEAFEVPSLISLTVSFARNDVLTLLTNSKLLKLVNLNLFYFRGLSDVIDEVSHLPTSITRLQVTLASVTPLPKLFRLVPHLISINLLMITFDGLILNNAWELPEKLEELYLEFGQYNDEDQSEVQPKMNVIKMFREYFKEKLRLSDKTKFLNLKRIYMYHIEALKIDVLWLLSLLLQRSPNVNFLHVTTTNTEKAIKQIEQIIMPLTKARKNQITHFELSVFSDEDVLGAIKNYNYHPTFFSELSKLAIHDSRQIIKRMIAYAIYACSITIRTFVGFSILIFVFKFDFPPFMVLALVILNDACSRRPFFLERPSIILICAFSITQFIATLIAVCANWTFTDIEGYGWSWAGIVWIWDFYGFFHLI
ncbi:unnamed protein product [Adineta steineri]|uniref:F-box domain-containing protein n=1 Tax=Adineta steineri TaxID=433720 RepID=A0A815NPG6_9BILA|nr:unnamed protein product [Adineta steineri]CAF1626150.1 unnamed protein product [Adineta steineri]